jgi:hypothetical protein
MYRFPIDLLSIIIFVSLHLQSSKMAVIAGTQQKKIPNLMLLKAPYRIPHSALKLMLFQPIAEDHSRWRKSQTRQSRKLSNSHRSSQLHRTATAKKNPKQPDNEEIQNETTCRMTNNGYIVWPSLVYSKDARHLSKTWSWCELLLQKTLIFSSSHVHFVKLSGNISAKHCTSVLP